MLRLAEDARRERLVPTPLEAEVSARKAEAAARQVVERRVLALEEELRRRG